MPLSPPPNVGQEAFNLPPDFTPIKSSYDLRPIPDTSLFIGTASRVGQTSSNELITCDQTKGIRGGCGHDIVVIDEIVNPNSTHRGIGGRCSDCAAEAAEKRRLNLISQQEYEALQLFCSQCASHCDGCRRTDICWHHAQEFKDLDGKVLLLCPACLKKADHEKFFKKTLAIMLSPFVDHKRLQDPFSGRNGYE